MITRSLDPPVPLMLHPPPEPPAAASPSAGGAATLPTTLDRDAADSARAVRLTWVPVRSLTSRHRSRVQTHLLSLNDHDRYLRFGYQASDAQIARYTDSLDFEHDEVFGIFNRRLELVAMAHLAHETGLKLTARGAMAEFGVSVGSAVRGRGYGGRLFDHAVLHARNRGFDTLFIHALSENVAMLKIARHAGATVERSGSETEAWLSLPPDSFASHVGAAVDHQAAEWDYRFKEHAQRVYDMLDGVAEVKDQMARAAHRSIE